MARGKAMAGVAGEMLEPVLKTVKKGTKKADDVARKAAKKTDDVTKKAAKQTDNVAKKSARKTGKANRSVKNGADRVRFRNESGLTPTAKNAEARRAYDKAHNTQPDWGDLTEQYHGPKPDDMTRPHGHHIVFKEGNAKAQPYLERSKAVLEKHGIDWYTGSENLIWAPNRGHSAANAKQVAEILEAADEAGGGRDAIVKALRRAGRDIFDGQP